MRPRRGTTSGTSTLLAGDLVAALTRDAAARATLAEVSAVIRRDRRPRPRRGAPRGGTHHRGRGDPRHGRAALRRARACPRRGPRRSTTWRGRSSPTTRRARAHVAAAAARRFRAHRQRGVGAARRGRAAAGASSAAGSVIEGGGRQCRLAGGRRAAAGGRRRRRRARAARAAQRGRGAAPGARALARDAGATADGGRAAAIAGARATRRSRCGCSRTRCARRVPPRAGREADARRHAAAGLDELRAGRARSAASTCRPRVAMHGSGAHAAGLGSAVRSGRPDVVFEWSERARHLSQQVVPLRPPPDAAAGRRPRRAADAARRGPAATGWPTRVPPSCAIACATAVVGDRAPAASSDARHARRGAGGARRRDRAARRSSSTGDALVVRGRHRGARDAWSTSARWAAVRERCSPACAPTSTWRPRSGRAPWPRSCSERSRSGSRRCRGAARRAALRGRRRRDA